jgi:perosamine synthetase
MPPEQIAELMGERIRVLPLLDDQNRVTELVLLDRRVRLSVAAPSLGERELEYVTECLLTGWISSAGKFVTRFEDCFAAFCGTRYAVATSSGTSALHLSLLALDIGPGDEVIVPSLTFIATANAVAYTGAHPVAVDSESRTWNMDPQRIEDAVTARTRAIIVVHLYGHPTDMDPVLDIARRHGLPVVEDAAEAHGATYKGRTVGSIGDVAAFSFYGNKIVTTGEGGMVATDRSDLAERVRLLRAHGMAPDRRYWHPVVGFNYRLTNLQAAVGVAQMERVDAILAAKRGIAAAYDEGLRGLPGLTLPPRATWAEPVFWLYSVLVDPDEFGCAREDLMARLDSRGVETRPLFPPIHTQPIYRTERALPVAERISRIGLSLPSAVGLGKSDITRVVETIRDVRHARC